MIKKLPFPRWAMVTPIEVFDYVEGEDGWEDKLIYSGLCCVSEKAREVLTAERELVRLSGKVLFEGDIYPGGEINRGYVVLDGKCRGIYRVHRARNPDGSIFSTEVELE